MIHEPVIGFIQTEKNDGSEDLLNLFAQDLTRKGWNIGGLVQHSSKTAQGSSLMELIDIRTGERFIISQPLGPDSSGCCLDAGGLCDSSAVLRREISAKVDLLIINKFAVAEAEGKGLLQELFMAVEHDIPILTSVASRYRPDWDHVMADCGHAIQPNLADLHHWWESVSAARKAHGTGD